MDNLDACTNRELLALFQIYFWQSAESRKLLSRLVDVTAINLLLAVLPHCTYVAALVGWFV